MNERNVHTARLASVMLAVFAACAGNAWAQGTYVAASVFGDVVRTSHADTTLRPETAGGGEAIGFALRIGTPLGAAWGVEAELAHPSRIDDEVELLALPYLTPALPLLVAGERAQVSSLIQAFPYRVRTSLRHTTISASAWAVQQLTGRVALVYLGGLGFYRSTREHEVTFGPLIDRLALLRAPFATGSVTYGMRPLAGMEARIDLTSRAHVIPGIRLHAIEDGWLVRPAVGIGWRF
jgi:hypothetical protein